jgi:hypothetical protein
LIEAAKTNGGSDNITVILGVVEGAATAEADLIPVEEAPIVQDDPLEESVTEQT